MPKYFLNFSSNFRKSDQLVIVILTNYHRFLQGKLLYCEPPPGITTSDYVCTPVISHTSHMMMSPGSRKGQAGVSEEDNSIHIDSETGDIDIVIDNSVSKKLDRDFFKQVCIF